MGHVPNFATFLLLLSSTYLYFTAVKRKYLQAPVAPTLSRTYLWAFWVSYHPTQVGCAGMEPPLPSPGLDLSFKPHPGLGAQTLCSPAPKGLVVFLVGSVFARAFSCSTYTPFPTFSLELN